MSDLFAYLTWRGDLPISDAAPLNEVDGMILARVAYFPFELFNWSSDYPLPELCQKISELPEETLKLPGDLELRKVLSSSPRFSSCVFSDFQKNFDSKATEQFAAITIHLNEREMCLAFCGTDATLVGWKEDLNMSFMVCVPSQGRALQYAEEIMLKYPNKKVYMVGHSKGGNLACYAGAFLPTGLAQRVLRVCSYDGPGFSDTVIQDPKMVRVRSKVQLFMPQDSIVGRIMNQIVEPVIIHSTNESIYQHDVYSWEVLGPKLVLSPDGATDFSTATGEAIKRVLSMTDPVQRKAVIDIVFDFLGSSNAHTVAEVRESMSKNMLSYLKALQGLSSKQVGEVMEVVSFFINAYASIFAKRTTDQAKQNAKTFWEQNVPEGARNVVEAAIDVASTIPIFQPKEAEKEEASDETDPKATGATFIGKLPSENTSEDVNPSNDGAASDNINVSNNTNFSADVDENATADVCPLDKDHELPAKQEVHKLASELLAHLSKPKSVEELLKTVAAEKASRAEEKEEQTADDLKAETPKAETQEAEAPAATVTKNFSVTYSNTITVDDDTPTEETTTASAENAENHAGAEDHEDTASEVKKTLTELFEKLRETLGKDDCQKDAAESEDTTTPEDMKE